MKSKLPIPLDKLVLRKVCIGGVSKSTLLKKLEEENISLNDLALNFINHNDFTTLPSQKKLQTVEISVKDLGYPDGANIDKICQKANAFGFGICPHELALHIRLQFIDLGQPKDPPKGNWQNIIVIGLYDEPEFIQGFYLRRREDGFWLRGYRASLDYLWDPADRFIFVKD